MPRVREAVTSWARRTEAGVIRSAPPPGYPRDGKGKDACTQGRDPHRLRMHLPGSYQGIAG